MSEQEEAKKKKKKTTQQTTSTPKNPVLKPATLPTPTQSNLAAILKVSAMAKIPKKTPQQPDPTEVDLTAIMEGMNKTKNPDDDDDDVDDSLDKTQEEEMERTLFIWKGNENRMKFPIEAFQECYDTFLDKSAVMQEEDDMIPLEATLFENFYHNSKLGLSSC